MPPSALFGVQAFAMEHAFIKYWRETFKPFQTTPSRFDVPGFQDPLVSANFIERVPLGGAQAHFNFVGDDGDVYLQAL